MYDLIGYGIDIGNDVFAQRIDADAAGFDIFGDNFDGRCRELTLIEYFAYLVLPGSPNQPRERTGRRFLAFVFDGDLLQPVVAGIIGKGGVVDDEVFDAALRDLLAGAGVQRP